MSYSRPTVSDFKAQLPRDFPYGVPAWGGAGVATVVSGVIVSIAVSNVGFGYTDAPDIEVDDSTGSGAVVTATVAKGQLTGFVVGNGGANYLAPTFLITGGAGTNNDLELVRDADIEAAFDQAEFNMNQELFSSQKGFTIAFNLLAAHMLVETLLASGEGLASQYNWLTSSKSAGDVAEAFQIPDRISRDPLLSMWSKTRYGALYLQIISPLLIGNFSTAFRQSLP